VRNKKYIFENVTVMNTTGIIIQRNESGIATFARIDLKKYGNELKDFFKSKGISVEKQEYDPDFVEKIKSQEDLPGVKIKASNVWD
jgi:ribosomal protein S12